MVKILSGRAVHCLLDKNKKERTVPAPIPQTPMTKSTLNTADPKMVPTPMSPLVMKTPAPKGRKFVGEFLYFFFLTSNARYSLIAEAQSRRHFHGGQGAVQELKFTIESGGKSHWPFSFIESVVEAFIWNYSL